MKLISCWYHAMTRVQLMRDIKKHYHKMYWRSRYVKYLSIHAPSGTYYKSIFFSTLGSDTRNSVRLELDTQAIICWNLLRIVGLIRSGDIDTIMSALSFISLSHLVANVYYLYNYLVIKILTG